MVLAKIFFYPKNYINKSDLYCSKPHKCDDLFKKLFSKFKNEYRKIYLCLSGGKVKATAFHNRVLKYLAQHDMFNKIDSISVVLAGNLLTGFIFSKNNLR